MSNFRTHSTPEELTVVVFGPRVDITTVSNLRQELLTLVESDDLPPLIVLDLGQLNALDSTGVALLVNLQKKVREGGREFRLMNVNDTIRQMLQLSNLLDLFQFSN